MKNLNPTHFCYRLAFAKYMFVFLALLMLALTSNAQILNDEPAALRSPNGFPPGWEYSQASPNVHGIIVFLEAIPRINQIPLQPGDYIGAFYTDDNQQLRCAGADYWLGDENIIFSVFGNDPDTPEKDGFNSGETMHFKVFYQANQKEYDVDYLAWDPFYTSNYKWYSMSISGIIDLQCYEGFDAFASATPNPLCLGDATQLNANIFINGSGNYSYTWTSDPPGFSSSLPNPVDTPEANTNYHLAVWDGQTLSEHTLPVKVNENPVTWAGNDQSICQNQFAQLAGTAVNASAMMWSTSGDGTFDAPTALTPKYFPGTADIANGQAILTLTAQPLVACTFVSTDNLVVTIQPLPAISAPSNRVFCENQTFLFSAAAESYASISWITSGDGTFANTQGDTVQYFPGNNDFLLKAFTVTACAQPVSPCSDVACTMIHSTIQDPPVLNAPPSRNGCEFAPITVNSASSNYDHVLWSTQGDGTFENAAVLNTKYYPGTADVAASGTTLTIAAFGSGACGNWPVTKDVIINIRLQPIANAGNDITQCAGNPVALQATASNAASIIWSTSGDGTFSNTSQMATNYFPGAVDASSGGCRIHLLANPTQPCTLADIDTLQLVLMPPAQVEIGYNNARICHDQNFHLDLTTAEHYASLQWSTVNGGGTFDDPSLLHPVYYPNAAVDYPKGCIVLGVTAQSINPCTVAAADFMTLCFQAPPTAFAGTDATIAVGEIYTPDAAATNHSGLQWQTTGDGTFNYAQLLRPQYFHGVQDKTTGHVSLILTASPMSGCQISAVDTVLITFTGGGQLIELYAGNNAMSTYINTEGKTFEEVIAPLQDKLLFAKVFNKVYWPKYGINTIGNYDISSGYELLLSSDTELLIGGVNLSATGFTLHAGWNLMPVLSPFSISGQAIVDLLGDALVIIATIDGEQRVFPAQNINTLPQLEPGKAYMIKMNEEATFDFPMCP
ncbi:MAG TPA: hypothetical protein VFC92_05625 [Bacteroidales bacterium]|nr:hypothetical protein [Bacteroidales bacterium]